MKNIIFILSVLFLVGCSSVQVYKLEPYMELSSQSIHIATPSSSHGTKWKAWYINSTKNNIQLFRHIPNMMSEDVRITVSIPERLKESTEKFLIKSFDYEKWAQNVLARPDIVANMKERGVTYSKKYIDYIGGLKCGTDVESSNIAMGVGHTKYYTVCGYYDVNGTKKRIDIFYNYTYTHSGTKNDRDTKSSSITPQDMQKQFKQDMKAIFDSLVIHDMDREKMNKEGLLHNKKYDLESEFR
jgi:hypothetical protein